MKKILLYVVMLISTLYLFPGCDKGFDETNTSKVNPTSLDPAFLLNTAVINSNYSISTLLFEVAIVQQMVTPFGGALQGGNLNQANASRTSGTWTQFYQQVLKYTSYVKEVTADDPNRSNVYNMARIWNSYGAMILTDTYGDVPYSQAGKGFLNGIAFPEYDPQDSIYLNILDELDKASAALDPAKAVSTSDALFGGDVTRWKRLGYSLMLRAAMRLSKVDQALAMKYVLMAVNGGVMQSNNDDAYLPLSPQYINPIGDFLNAAEANNYYLAEPFVSYLKDNNDPRLTSIAIRYVGAKSGPDQVPANGSTDPSVQIGMPMGYDDGTIKAKAASSGLASFYDYSQLNRKTMGSNAAPVFFVTFAQTQLLLAEAVTRGWIQGNASDLYESAIKANMQDYQKYSSSSAINESAIDTYVHANTLKSASALEQINTQYWVASFLNGPEAFANFRRSGFPDLTPNPYPGDIPIGEFIRRLTYPASEYSVNLAHVTEAVSRQGADKLDTRIWWDKK